MLRFVSIVLLSLFQRSVILHSVGPTRYRGQEQCVISPIFCRKIDTPVKTSLLLALLFIGPSIHQSRSVCHQFYFFYMAINMLVKAIMSLVLLFVGLSTHWSRTVCSQSYILQYHQYTSQEHCIVSPTFCRTIVVIHRVTWRTFRPQPQNVSLKKLITFSLKTFFLYFGKWNILVPRLENFLYFPASALKMFP